MYLYAMAKNYQFVKKEGFPGPVWISCFLAFHFLAPRIGYLLDDLCGCQT